MNLTEWATKNNVYVGDTHGAKFVNYTGNDWQLWHLTDYAVSTRSGPVVWLVPRN